MGKTLSIRMDDENYKFLNSLAKDEDADLSKAVRDVVCRGRILLAIERYKKGTASLGRAAEIAGVPVGEMIAVLSEYGVKSNLRKEDYLAGLANLETVG
jgi:predicted HTH domain antitoxin